MVIRSTSSYTSNLKPFDCTGEQSIVVMDNASIHHVDGIVDMIYTRSWGVMIMFIPHTLPTSIQVKNYFFKLNLQENHRMV